MKKILRNICLASLAIIFVLKSYNSGSAEVKARFDQVKNENSVERGKNLVYTICASCHYNKNTGKFTGNQMKDLPGIMGKLYSANLTDSREYGRPPHYTDEELYRLLRTGIKKDGGFAPYMLRPNMSDEDINDIIAYLRSGDDAVSDGETVAGKTHVNLLGRVATRMIAKPGKYETGVPSPREDNAVEYGGYLVDIIGCYHCHSKSISSLNYKHPEDSKGYMAGGQKFKTPSGHTVYAPNLTPDLETGIGNFTREDMRNALQKGIAPDGDKLHAPMPKFSHLTNEQSDAIYTYLMQLPAKHHFIK